jgi:hypothetical protein
MEDWENDIIYVERKTILINGNKDWNDKEKITENNNWDTKSQQISIFLIVLRSRKHEIGRQQGY